MAITKEQRSTALSVRAKLAKSLHVPDSDGILTATERGQIEKMVTRLTLATTPAKKPAKAKGKAKGKAKAKSTKAPAPVKKAA